MVKKRTEVRSRKLEVGPELQVFRQIPIPKYPTSRIRYRISSIQNQASASSNQNPESSNQNQFNQYVIFKTSARFLDVQLPGIKLSV